MPDEKVIVEIKLLDRGQLKAFADVTLTSGEWGEITIKAFHVVQKDLQAPWVAFPAISYTKDGKKVNKPILEMSKKLQAEIRDAVLFEFKKARGEN